jgi:two-component system chemotaxis sensor kinase CheA
MDPDILKELLQEFITETSESLQRLEKDLLSYETGSADADTLNRVFRVIHTVKGSGGSLALKGIEALSHEAEQLLDAFRELKMVPDTEVVGIMLEVLDILKSDLVHLQETGAESGVDVQELKLKLRSRWKQLMGVNGDATGEHESDSQVEVLEPDTYEGEGSGWGIFGDADDADEEGHAKSKPKRKRSSKAVKQVTPVKESSETAIESISEKEEPKVAPSASADLSESTIRVEIKQLDVLMALVGELVLTRNQILQKASEHGGGNMDPAFVHLDHLTSELQLGMMKTRMQPIGNALTKVPRIVRDVAQSLGKEVCLEVNGKDTELDRSLIEAIKDPLLHLVRNSVDHGIETPEERVAAGKDRKGILFISAYHESGQVHIDIIDDGRGIDLNRIREKAVQTGIETQESVSKMSEREVLYLIFHPGFSTAKTVSNISGRGVGMDVVRSNIERIGGSIEVQSELGHGTSVKLKIPLTLAIVPALIVGAGNERFAIPQLSLQELVQLEGEQVRTRVESLYESKVYRLRGEIIPLVFLREVLALKGASEGSGVMNIVVLQSDRQLYGLVVDAVYDCEEIVVKPLSRHLKRMSCYSGATIMGDGSVALILDAQGFGRHSKALNHKREDGTRLSATAVQEDQKESTPMLLFTAGANARMAVPLADVNRIEAVENGQFENRRGEVILQHRGEILKIIDLSRFVPGMQCVEAVRGAPMTVIVHSQNNRSIGVLVSEVLDIVHEVIDIQEKSDCDVILGSQPMGGKVTELLDLGRLINRVHPLYIQSPIANEA